MTALLLSPKKAAAKLDMTLKMLREHRKDGTIECVIIGRGKKRPRYAFAPSHLEDFIERQTTRNAPCQSTGRKATPSTTTTSRSEVIGFLQRREKLLAARHSK